jgi:uncharacterized protein (TIGR03086 family)
MSHDWLALYRRAGLGFARRIAVVSDWSAPGVRGIVTHVLEEQRQVPHLLAGRTAQQALADLEPLRDDLAAEWSLYSFAAAAAWRSTDHSTIVQVAGDAIPALDFLQEQVAELAIHTWDLAHAIGADEQLDDEVVEAVWTVFEPQRGELLASGVAVPLGDEAPLQDRMLALTGRTASGFSAKPVCAMAAAAA